MKIGIGYFKDFKNTQEIKTPYKEDSLFLIIEDGEVYSIKGGFKEEGLQLEYPEMREGRRPIRYVIDLPRFKSYGSQDPKKSDIIHQFSQPAGMERIREFLNLYKDRTAQASEKKIRDFFNLTKEKGALFVEYLVEEDLLLRKYDKYRTTEKARIMITHYKEDRIQEQEQKQKQELYTPEIRAEIVKIKKENRDTGVQAVLIAATLKEKGFNEDGTRLTAEEIEDNKLDDDDDDDDNNDNKILPKKKKIFPKKRVDLDIQTYSTSLLDETEDVNEDKDEDENAIIPGSGAYRFSRALGASRPQDTNKNASFNMKQPKMHLLDKRKNDDSREPLRSADGTFTVTSLVKRKPKKPNTNDSPHTEPEVTYTDAGEINEIDGAPIEDPNSLSAHLKNLQKKGKVKNVSNSPK